MCELFGISAFDEMSFTDWLIPFRARGGAAADNPDGWGIASWANNQAKIKKSPEPGWRSEHFRELAESLTSRLLLAHVRKARHPPVPGLLNTHPFAPGELRVYRDGALLASHAASPPQTRS